MELLRLIFALILIQTSLSAKAQILSSVLADEDCHKPAEVFVAQGKQLLFQIHVPVGGTFDIKLNPGKYELIAINEEGCEGHRQFLFKKNQINIPIKIVKNESGAAKRKPNFVATDTAISSRTGFYAGLGGGIGLYTYPWWYPWSQYMFPLHYSYPCAWAVWGCNSRYYPSGGAIAMGKPNIYIEGPDVQDAKLELDKVEHHKLMATAPAHMEKGWTFSLEDNSLKVQGIKYPHLFYDSRADLDRIPNQTVGFCGTREVVLDRMHDTLEVLKFPKTAQKDFAEHWMSKLPKLKEFCVYPQVNEQLQGVVPMKISLDSYSLSRILFLTIPKPGRRDLPKEVFIRDFVKRVPAEWTPPDTKVAKVKWKIFEWGVAFPFEKTEK